MPRPGPAHAGRPLSWLAAGVLLTLGLRAPWGDAALGRDEAGLALIAAGWSGEGAHAYGEHFIDRPPVLLAAFRLAHEVGGPHGIRALGALAAISVVIITTLLAVRIAGRAAAPWAALISALLCSSLLLQAVFTPGELVASVPVSLSVLLLAVGLDRSIGRHAALAAAGALAAAALLVKQSFGGALLAGVVGIAVSGVLTRPGWRHTAARAAAYAAGVAAVILGLWVWQSASDVRGGAVAYALVGFRLDALGAIEGADVGDRATRLVVPLVGSGLAALLICAVAGIARLRDRPATAAALAAWLVGALVGVALGGSYWPHYLIALAPVTAVGAAVMFAARPRAGAFIVSLVVTLGVVVSAGAALRGAPARHARDAVTVAQHVRDRARPSDSAHVMYAYASVLYYAGLRAPFAYHWSLMMQAAPGAERELRRLLASPRRPTWLIERHRPWAFGLDRDGVTRRLIETHYRPAGIVCGMTILVARRAGDRVADPNRRTRSCRRAPPAAPS
ncbi:MAG TPA: hypothetical protein VGV90_10015 [Solirubrobacteraceae bacterium]|nr:hypothetical protein [Solirubrobacteraceae bacterium]